MGRMGVPKMTRSCFQEVSPLPNIKFIASRRIFLFRTRRRYTREEPRGFENLVEQLRAKVPAIIKRQCCQSAGLLAFADPTFDIVLPASCSMAFSPLPAFQQSAAGHDLENRKSVCVCGHAAGSSNQLRERTFYHRRDRCVSPHSAAGYADGYPRHASNRDAPSWFGGPGAAPSWVV